MAALFQHGIMNFMFIMALIALQTRVISSSFISSPVSFEPAFAIPRHRQPQLSREYKLYVANDDDDGALDPVVLPGGIEDVLTRQDLEGLTVPQLKQQLRLRGLKISGRKTELVDRLVAVSFSSSSTMSSSSPSDVADTEDAVAKKSSQTSSSSTPSNSKATKFAQDRGKEFVDISEYLDEKDKGKTVKTWKLNDDVVDAEFEIDEEDEGNSSTDSDGERSSKSEVWGSEARIVDDYEGRKLVVDCLSQTVVEFRGSNSSYVSALVVASRDALKPYLAGGEKAQNKTAAEERLREIQTKREQAHKQPVRFEDNEGADTGDETGLYANIIERDFSDWGKYTLTGAQLSAAEVQGVLLLSDVYGAFSPDTQTLAEKIAFECQPVVVMVPDLFRGNPWEEAKDNPGKNENGNTYEEWRASHSDLRVSVDIRAAAACLRERYGVSSVVVWGTCYGGGRALEAAAGYLPDDRILDIDGNVGPPLVNPMATVAWYPTRYNASALFGKKRVVGGRNQLSGDEECEFAVMAVFAGEDLLPGATQDDAVKLKALLAEDDRVKDHLVKVFSGQDHGFAHIGLAAKANMDKDTAFERFVDEEFGGAGQVSMDDGEAEVACLLSTAFMETYSRAFLPTTGAPISSEQNEWSSDLEVKGLGGANARDIRKEIEESLDNFVEEPLEGISVDPTDESQRTALEEYLRSIQADEEVQEPFKIEDDDDIETMYAKLKAWDEQFELF